MDALLKAIEHVGGQTALAKKLGTSKQTVHAWVSRGNVPAEWAPSIERVTDRFVTAEELCTDVEWWVIRGRRTKRAA